MTKITFNRKFIKTNFGDVLDIDCGDNDLVIIGAVTAVGYTVHPWPKLTHQLYRKQLLEFLDEYNSDELVLFFLKTSDSKIELKREDID